ncbi:polysaccharide biosynthesis protein [Paenibacillaceae bacterium]|nr:polysaccharide biosynthesis protein [Paenibacillaceae bacterium]
MDFNLFFQRLSNRPCKVLYSLVYMNISMHSNRVSIKVGDTTMTNPIKGGSVIRDVPLEKLLGREPVTNDLDEISNYIQGAIVLVTGAGGSIGSELCRQIASFAPQRLILLGHGENSIYLIASELASNFPNLPLTTVIADIRDQARMQLIFARFVPQLVFHAAAHKHVPLMEDNPGEAIKNNVLGTQITAACAHQFHAQRFVLISTDKAVNPSSIMGMTKRLAEMMILATAQSSATKFSAVRFGNVLGSRGSVIPLFKRQIAEGGPVTVTHPEMVRFFMTIPEAVQLVIQAGALANRGEIFVLDMGSQVKIDTLARELIRLSGMRPDDDIKIVYTGIRPGEKLYEEILTDREGALLTKHNKIYISTSQHIDKQKADGLLKELAALADAPDNQEIVSKMSAIVKGIDEGHYS